jgi:EmrB/QacA subfamily drug resistance transporter
MKNNKWLILGLLAAAQFMVVLDNSIVNVALPVLKTALGFSDGTLQWVIIAYTLTFGGFLLLGGRAADLFGRRRVLITGMLAFTAISLLIGLSRSQELVIALRSLQGAAAALMSPAALSILLNTFAPGKERNAAIGIWSSVAAGGAAVGVLLGGVLTQYFGWEWNFFINVPIGLAVAYGIFKNVPAHLSEASHRNLDIPGALLVTSGLIALVYGLTEAPTWGWTSGQTLGILGLSAALLAGFLVNEAKAKAPLMPLSIFKIRNLSGANLVMMPTMAAMYSMFFFCSLFIENILHYTPLQTGLSFLPIPIVLGTVANLTPRFLGKIGFKPIMVTGTALTAIGMLWLSTITEHTAYLTGVLPALLLIAVGVGMSFVSVNVAATSGVPANEAGLASGIIVTSQQLGGALGLAILSSIVTATISGALQAGNSLAAASTQGYSQGFFWGAIFALAALTISVLVIKQKPNSAEQPQVAAAH